MGICMWVHLHKSNKYKSFTKYCDYYNIFEELCYMSTNSYSMQKRGGEVALVPG